MLSLAALAECMNFAEQKTTVHVFLLASERGVVLLFNRIGMKSAGK